VLYPACPARFVKPPIQATFPLPRFADRKIFNNDCLS